jgi:putative transposase
MVTYVVSEWKLSYSQACKMIGYSRNGKYYVKKMPVKDAPILEAITKQTSGSRRGRKKIIPRLQMKNPEWRSSRIRRIYCQGGFSLNRKPSKPRVKHVSNPITLTTKTNEEWAIDFMSDALVNGRRIRPLNVVDHYNRYCLGISVSHNFPARRAVQILERMIEKYGKPKRIRTDNGPEFLSKYFQKWLRDNDITWSSIPKGRPDQNAIVERFNRSYREEVLDAQLFFTIDQAQHYTDIWVDQYNNEWNHESLNFKTPAEYAIA